ncbi:jg12934 [Pararge aegeria aegeria]|uniref:Jg12934 protein n=1 Tax=Pararge aegeria aegeria TaxID=348720 RepID=A0A8S4SGS2_9NEOP|nr:jg12934 [Pararge aegeria aegeria]
MAKQAIKSPNVKLLPAINTYSARRSYQRSSTGNEYWHEEEVETGEGTTAAEAIKSVLSSNNPVFSLQRQSSKIKAVMECLNKNVFVNKGEKAVVVSQWTSVLNLVERELKAARVRSVTLRGDVPVPARASLITALNDPRSDVRVMLLSLCAGGVGLNLCGANHLLLLDPHWNPQLEEQAQDRIYRVGQVKHVHIYRFMCVDTVEQSIRQLQKAKLELAENVLTGAKNTNGSKLSIEELKILFNMGPQGDS